MNKLRNPFKLRASERIESDTNFLRLFSPEVLDMIIEEKRDDLWNNVIFIRSSPGAGKTSLLRIFEPNSLNTIFNHRSQPEYKELFTALKQFDVIDNKQVNALGVLIRCSRNYQILDDINYQDIQKTRLFNALFNARIVLGTLKSIISLLKLRFPDDLIQIGYKYSNKDFVLPDLENAKSGLDLYNWASKIEKNIYEILDSFIPPDIKSIEGHDEIFSLTILRPENFTFESNHFFNKILFMVDDAHKLSTNQRIYFHKYVTENRGNYTIWIAERLEGIPDFRSYLHRDYNEINLETFWSNNVKKFRTILSNIASKRAAISSDDVNSFKENIGEEIDEHFYKNDIKEYKKYILNEITNLTSYSSKFEFWIKYLDEFKDDTYENVLRIGEVLIVINRDKNKNQLAFDFPLSIEELKEKIDSSVEAASKLFLSKETRIPYYYGFQKLVSISSNNIEQFISFASFLFEEMLSNKISGKEVQLNPQQQERIIKSLVSKKWKELTTLIPESRSIKLFLDNLGEFCNKVTYKPTASYGPGINGFSINMKVGLTLHKEPEWLENELFSELQNLLSICIAFNLLEVREVNQGAKGEIWTVYYLNRWLCVKYNLPFTFGGWNKINPEELVKWTKKKY